VSSARSVADGEAAERHEDKSNRRSAGGGELSRLTSVLGRILTSASRREMSGV